MHWVKPSASKHVLFFLIDWFTFHSEDWEDRDNGYPGYFNALGNSSFNSPRQKSGLVHKGGGGGTLSPDFSWEPFFGHFLGLFKAFLGLFTTWWPLKNSLESRKGRGGGGGQKVWTSPDFCRGELNDEFPKDQVSKRVTRKTKIIHKC